MSLSKKEIAQQVFEIIVQKINQGLSISEATREVMLEHPEWVDSSNNQD